MKKFALVIRLIKKQRLLNIILMVEIALTLVLLSMINNRYKYNYQLVNLIDSAQILNSLNYVGKLPQLIETEKDIVIYKQNRREELEEYLINISEFQGISDIRDESLIDVPNNKYYYFTTYDSTTASKFKLKMKEGAWFTDVSCKDGIIPIVVVDTSENANVYKIGDLIQGSLFDYDESYEIKVRDNQKYYFQVVGIVSPQMTYIFAPHGQRNYTATYEKLISKLETDTQFFLCENFAESNSEVPSNFTIFLDENASDERISKIKSGIDQIGYCDRIADMRKETISVLETKIRLDFPLFFSMLCISIIGIISISILNLKKQRKDFAIYSLCGCSAKKSLLIYLEYLIFIMGSSFVLYIGIMKLANHSNIIQDRALDYLFIISLENIMNSLYIYAIMLLLSSIIPMLINRKKTILRKYYLY